MKSQGTHLEGEPPGEPKEVDHRSRGSAGASPSTSFRVGFGETLAQCMSDAPTDDPRQRQVVFRGREMLVAIGFTLASAAAHLVWNPITEYWQYVATALMFVAFLTFWLVTEWRRLDSFVTRFYCIAVIFDIFAEGLLQPFHHCTFDNIMCTGRLFLVFFAFWLVLRPVERWVAGRRVARL